MALLLAVSLLWGFSFGLVKTEFSTLSASTLAAVRLLIALPCFLPFLARPFRRLNSLTCQLLLIGAIQYGCMYVALFSSFRWLNGYEVALLTIFTPLFVILADAILGRRLPPLWFWATALLSVLGALWIFQPRSLPDQWPGILLMQVANGCFAIGQVAWRRIRPRFSDHRERDVYALLFIGGALAALPFAVPHSPHLELLSLDGRQWAGLLYLGAIASGLGFFLWNAGAGHVNPATLAVFNNLKIPIAIVISVLVFKESADPANLIPGLAVLLLALGWAERAHRRTLTRSGGP